MEKYPPLQLGVVAIEKGAFELTSITLANFIYHYHLGVGEGATLFPGF